MTEPLQRWRGVLLAIALVTAGCSDEPILPDPDQPTPGYELRIVGGETRAAALMEVVDLVIEVDRIDGGYEGPITFTADPPPGIVVIFRPTTVLISNSTDVLVVADASVEPKLYQIVLTGTAPERPDRAVILDLTVTP